MIRAALAVLAMHAGVAHADDVTYAEVVAAVARAPAVQAGTYDVAAAERRVDAAGAWNPTNVRAGTNRLTARLVFGIALPLPILGTIGAARDEAAAHAVVVRDDAALARRDVRQRAIVAWFELARADAAVTAQDNAARQATELETIAKGRFDAGAGGEVDVTTAHAAKARADVAVTAAKRESRARSADLAAVLGWDPDVERHASGAMPDGDAGLEQLRTGLATHPERAAIAAQLAEHRAAEHRISVAKRPGLAAEVTVSYDDVTQGRDSALGNTDVYAGLAIDLPLFGHLGDQLDAARADSHAAQLRLQGADAQLAAELVAAYRRWEAAAERVTSLEQEVLPSQQKATRLAHDAFREGARDLATALQATRDLQQLESELANARIDRGLAWQAVIVAAGRDGADAR